MISGYSKYLLLTNGYSWWLLGHHGGYYWWLIFNYSDKEVMPGMTSGYYWWLTWYTRVVNTDCLVHAFQLWSKTSWSPTNRGNIFTSNRRRKNIADINIAELGSCWCAIGVSWPTESPHSLIKKLPFWIGRCLRSHIVSSSLYRVVLSTYKRA